MCYGGRGIVATMTEDEPPAPSYHLISERLRKSTSSDLQCQLFCGGKGCKYCGGFTWPDDKSAIKGLFSHWVTDDILATSRPTTKLIATYDVIEKFKEHGISSIFNLQMAGEHASCGPSLEKEGFSYKPMDFMDKQIFFYNFGCKDYGTLPKHTILDIVKVMAFSLRQGKIAVHCHAGLGRTGVLIACYLIYWLQCRANDAVRYVRLKRPGSIQTSEQILCVQEFAQYVLPLFVVFPRQCEIMKKCHNLWQCLEDQNKVLHGLEQRHLRYVPRVIYHCCERLIQLATPTNANSSDSLDDSENVELTELTAFYNDFIGNTFDESVWKPALTPASSTPALSSAASDKHKTEDEMMISGLNGLLECTGLYSNLDSSDDDDDDQEDEHDPDAIQECTTDETTENLDSLERNAIYKHLMSSKAVRVAQVSSAGHSCLHLPCLRRENKIAPTQFEEKETLGRPLPLLQTNGIFRSHIVDPPVEETDFYKGSTVTAEHGQSSKSSSRRSATVVAKCMLFQYSDLQPSFWLFVQKYKKALNEDAGAWERLRNEPNPCVVAALLWGFLEVGLQDPVLSSVELTRIVLKPVQPTNVLPTLPKGVRTTTEYLVRFLTRLDVDDELRTCLVQRLCASLTHQKIQCQGALMPNHMKWPKMREGTSKELVNFINSLIDAVHGDRWETVASPESSANSFNNNLSAGSSKAVKLMKSVNIVALAIAR